MRLHEATLLDADFGYKPDTETTQTLVLKAGYHPVKISYLNNKSQAEILLKWKVENGEWHVMKEGDFYHDK